MQILNKMRITRFTFVLAQFDRFLFKTHEFASNNMQFVVENLSNIYHIFWTKQKTIPVGNPQETSIGLFFSFVVISKIICTFAA